MASPPSAVVILRRIDRRLKALGLSDNKASAEATGSRDTLRTLRRHVSKGEQRGISTETIRKLAPVLLTTEQWLQHEIGPETADDAALEAEEIQPRRRERITRVPLLSWVSAGRLSDTQSQIPVDDVPLLAFADLGRGEFFALKVEGDSMDRLSPEGSVIVVNRADREPRPGKPYVFFHRTEGTTYKLWHANPDYLAPHSWNGTHQPIFIKRKKDLEVVGRVRKTMLDL